MEDPSAAQTLEQRIKKACVLLQLLVLARCLQPEQVWIVDPLHHEVLLHGLGH